MRKPFFLAGLLPVLVTLFITPALALDLAALIRDVEIQYTGRSSHAIVSMQVSTEHWQRTMEMESWSLGRDYFITRITEPAKDRGVATLKRDKDVWNYLPKVDRVVKVPASLMGGSWMGSHITNDDLVKGSQVDKDYTFQLLHEDEGIYRIEGIPRPEAAVVWGRIVYTLDRARRVPLRVDYFDEDGIKVRELVFSEVQQVGDRLIPLTMTVQPMDKPDEKTVVRYRDISFDISLQDDFFSLRNLKKR